MFSNSDAQAGLCSAIIKDATEEFGKWRSHVCRYERPYMCKRPLNSKMDHVGNTTLKVLFRCFDFPSDPFLLFLPPALCPPGWQSFAGNCYWMVSNINLLTTWHQAFTKCSDMGAYLLIINR